MDASLEYVFEYLIDHLVEAERNADAQRYLQNLRWLQKKLEATNVVALIRDFSLFLKKWPQQENVASFERFVKSQAHILQQNPTLMFQQAINEPDNSQIFRAAQSLLNSGKITHPWIKWVNKPQSINAQILTLKGHRDRVLYCAWSPDGGRIVSASNDGTLRIWDANNGLELQRIEGNSEEVTSCAWSLDGKRIFSAFRDGTLKVWDTLTVKEIQTIKLPELQAEKASDDTVYSCAWSPDGRRILSPSTNKYRVWDPSNEYTFKIMDTKTGQALQELKGHTAEIRSFAWSPDGGRIVSASNDGTLRIWDANNGQELHTLRENCVSFAWSPEGDRVVSTSFHRSRGQLKVWDARTGLKLKAFRGHTADIRSCAWSPDGGRIVSASNDGTLKIWNVETGKELQTLEGHSNRVISCAWSPGEHIVSASEDWTLKIWNPTNIVHENQLMKKGAKAVKQTRQRGGYWCSLSPDGARVLSPSQDRTLKIWDPHTGKILKTLKGIKGLHIGITSCAWSPDGQRILSASDDWELQLWDTHTGKILQRSLGGTSFAWSPDGERILSFDKNSDRLSIWDGKASQRLLCLTGHHGGITSCAWSPDGGLIASAAYDKTLRFWNIHTRKYRTLEKKFFGHASFAWSPDGERILSFDILGEVIIWDTRTGKILQKLGKISGLTQCVWSPDGERIVSASDDGELQLWDTHTGKILQTLKGTKGVHSKITSCAWSPDGEFIISASAEDYTIKIWDTQTGSELIMFDEPSLGHIQGEFGLGDGGRKIVACDGFGRTIILNLTQLNFTTPKVQPVYLYHFERKKWDNKPTVKCQWCGRRFAITVRMGGAEIECKDCGKKLQINPISKVRR